ncbi:MAG: class I SAM-dependent methyltransferase [Gammaproteobacteria bacterium]|nr:class I SAM-dependent methyltransferase [Gammaproteobacteria bacterium]
MERQPETELMNEEEQARAYALADFSEPHENFVELFKQSFPGVVVTGDVLDLGCGPADIAIRFAKRFPDCQILAVDGAEMMLKFGQEAIEAARLSRQITLKKIYLPTDSLPHKTYQAIISNSLLHHLQDPRVLWQTVKQYAQHGASVFVMDLMRPRSESAARDLVEEYAGNEPDILKRDFYHSLLAAYTVGEVEEQLEREVLLEFSVKPVSDRHFIVAGTV